MLLKDYLMQLIDLAKENPEALDYEVITAKDDEGNGYCKVHYSPAVGHFSDGEYSNEGVENVVCLN